MDLNTAWFLLIGILITGYAILDGFDLGVGVFSLFTKSDEERRILINAVGPFWDGNEVWLLAGGGALFAAFPPVYATVFSGFYLAFMLLLFALIFRAVSLEFRGKIQSVRWRNFWDGAFGIGSLVPAVLYGAAVGNVLRSLPVDADGLLKISFLNLLNPYALLLAALGLLMFIMHGSIFVAIKAQGDLQQRAVRWASRAWMVFVVLYIAATSVTFFVSPFLFEGILGNPLFWIFILMLLGGVVFIPVTLRACKYTRAFIASAITISAMIGITGVSLFPRMVPSSIDLAYSLTAYNASSTKGTLTVMLVIALVGMPIVLAYTAYIYRTFKGKVTITHDSY